ncbi:MAG: WG repeat-containing protein [Bacteroidetes bacterium]|nr:WG repeat-containing protein [Bacteroidota bacterium]
MRKNFFLFLLTSSSLFTSPLEKGFEALKIYNYFEAKKLFTSSLRHHLSGASYGLSIIFYRNDNPFYNIDSAYKYILISEKKFKTDSPKEKENLSKLSINQKAIEEQKEKIIQRAFEKAKTENLVETYNWFIKNFSHDELKKQATALRNKVAFENAKKANTAQAYKDFISTYPDAEEIKDAKWLYDFTLFNSMTKPNNMETYEEFIKKFPKSPYRLQAQDSVFTYSTRGESIEEYRTFIKKFPDNHNVKISWEKIYSLSTLDFTPKAFQNFLFDNPDFPDKEKVKADLLRAKMNLLPVVQDGKWGFIDSLGNMQIPPTYDWADEFSEGAAAVTRNEKSGYINKAGNIFIPLSYDETNSFHNGMAVVKKENKSGLISKTGKQILPLEFEDISGNEGEEKILLALKEGVYNYFDSKGKLLTGGKFEKAGDFSSGRAYIVQNGQYGFINRKGEIIIPAVYNWAESFKPNGTARVKLADKFGMIDTSGKSILQCEYDRIDDFSEGLVLVVKNKKFGFADEKGNSVIPIKFDYSPEISEVKGFQNGLAKVEQNKKRGLINKSGNSYLPLEYDDIRNFSEELCAVKRAGKWSYISRDKKQKINFQFDYAWDFSGDLARVEQKKKKGFINQKGEFIIPATYDEATDFKNGISIATLAGKKGALDSSGKIIIPFEMDEITEVHSGILKLEKNNKTAYFNLSLQKQIWTETGF